MDNKHAWELYESKKYEEAKKAWCELLREDFSPSNRSGYAYTLIAMAEYGEAREICRRLWIETSSHVYVHQLIKVEREAGNFKEAMKYARFEETVLPKDDPLAYAANLYEQGKLKELLGELDNAFKLALHCWEYSAKSKDVAMKACSKRLLGDISKARNQSCYAHYYLDAATLFIEADDEDGAQEMYDSLKS